LPTAPYFYFVHSYYPVPARNDLISARCIYGEAFAASVSTRNLHATQFHPEKSQSSGLTMLRNFLGTLNSKS
jgi:imidazole glycerol-phosphate synthase subunit HisH